MPAAPSPLRREYIYEATLMRCVDGDTVRLSVSLGFNVVVEESFRLWGINAPEMKGDTHAAGITARDYLEGRIRKYATGWDQTRPKVLLKSHKAPTQDKYGRWLAELQGFDQGAQTYVNINDLMVRDGHAVEYMRD